MTAYVIVDMDVRDPKQYERYKAVAAAAVAHYGGKYIVRGGPHETLEGDWTPARLVLLQFDSVEAAKRWYASPEYEAARALRQGAAIGRLVVVEGM